MVKEDQNISHADRLKFWLEEYRICSSRADQLTTLIWTLATALLSLNAGGLLFAGQVFVQAVAEKSGQTITPVSVMTTIAFSEIVAVVSVFILNWWNRVANRWNSYITVWYYRMKEIEAIPGMEMWANRDIDILDANRKKRKLSEFPPAEQVRSEQLNERGILKKYSGYSPESIGRLRGQLTTWTARAWLLLICTQILSCISILYTRQITLAVYDVVWLVIIGVLAIVVLWAHIHTKGGV